MGGRKVTGWRRALCFLLSAPLTHKQDNPMQKATKILATGGAAALLLTISSNSALASVTCYHDFNTRYIGGTSGQSTCYDNSALYRAKAQNDILGAVLKVYDAAARSQQQAANQKAASDHQQYLIQHATDKTNDRFAEVFGREPNNAEFNYWFNRIQQESLSHDQVKEKMAYYKATGRTMPAVAAPKVAGASTSALAPKINSIFRSVYTRNPSVSENHYWLSRINDKPTEQALRDAMLFHKGNGINH